MSKRKRNENVDESNDLHDTKKQKANSNSATTLTTLKRTGTIVIPEDDTQQTTNSSSTLIRRTSSLISTDCNLEKELSKESQLKLEKTLSSILMPSNSSARITIRTPVSFDVCTDFRHDNKKKPKDKSSKSNEPANNIAPSAKSNDEQLYTVDDIPLEIWVDILLRIPNIDRWQMAQTSQRFYQIFKYYVGYDKVVYFSYLLYELFPGSVYSTNFDENDKQNLTTDCFEYINSGKYAAYYLQPSKKIVLYGKNVKGTGNNTPINIDMLVIYKQQQELDLSSAYQKNKEISQYYTCEELVGLAPNRQMARYLKYAAKGTTATPDTCYPNWAAFPHKLEKVICLNAESVNNIDENMLIGYKEQYEQLALHNRRPYEEANYVEILAKAVANKETPLQKQARWQKFSECASIPTKPVDATSSVQFVYNPEAFGVKVNHIIHTRQMRDKIFRNELSDYDKFVLLHAARIDAINTAQSIQWPKSYHGLSNTIPHPQPQGVKLKLYEYQLRGLSWMKKIEDEAMKKEYSFNVVIRGAASLDFFMKSGPFSDDLLPDNLQIIDPQDAELQLDTERTDLIDSFKVRGGFLADEMGLGKTISMISLIVANPRKAISPDQPQANEPDASEKKAAEGLAEEYEAPLERINALFEIKATLVLCPSQLVQQWASEITKHSELDVVEITTIKDLRCISYKTIIDTDVVIVSHQFMNNTSYKKLCGKWSGLRSKMMSANIPEPSNKFTPILQYFGWQNYIRRRS